MRFAIGIAIGLVAIGLGQGVRAGPDERPYLDLPIHQSVNRGGALRYAVWVKVGERTVEALLDTGSTGLRVLASVMPGDIAGTPTDMGFGGTLHMRGQVIRAPIEIGSMKGEARIEIVQEVGCLDDTPDCGAAPVDADSFRIGGDTYAHQGYSAVLGIGLPFIATDIDQPLKAVGAKRWIVDLPRPLDESPGHLVLDPGVEASRGFTRLPRHGKADADGCVEGDFLVEKKCGTVLFDTGAPALSVAYEGVKSPASWTEHMGGRLSLTLGDDTSLVLAFRAGESGGLKTIGVTPPMRHGDTEVFILAGVSPFFAYDMLYDEAAHTVAVRPRPPMPAPGGQISPGTEAPSTKVAGAGGRDFGDEIVDPRYRRWPDGPGPR